MYEILILFIAVPLAALPIWFILNRIWDICKKIEKRRWLLFFFPALILASAFTWLFYRAPVIWHKIEIIPAPSNAAKKIELYEIKYPPGKTIKFFKKQGVKGWIVDGNAIKTVNANPAPLEYSFFSPIGETVSLLFLRSPDSRNVKVILDGKTLQVDLDDQNTDLISIEMTTAYKLGIPAGLILALSAIIDFSSFFFFILFIWLVQEISQFTPVNAEKQKQRESFLSHRTGIAALLFLALAFHTLNFLAVPLIVGPDSPSFLVGASYWIQHHNFDGVPAARGPGMAFLLIPGLWMFGRNVFGVKVTLHLLAIASALVMYWMGWQIFRRRSFAFFSGLIAVFMPEMYLYSNVVMSDVPNMFFTLLYSACFISALETLSWKNTLVCMLVSSFATLLRPENITLPLISAGFLLLKIIWEKENVYKRLKILGITFLIALLPLAGWASHNKRLHNFFGLSNYADAILYDGWVYYGEASGLSITDPDSPDVQLLAEAFNAYDGPVYFVIAPTALDIYPALIQRGYTASQAMTLLGDVARHSILNDPSLSMRLYALKIRKSFFPEFVMALTFPIYETIPHPDYASYFDAEKPLFPSLRLFQRGVYDWQAGFNPYYRLLVLFCLGVTFLALYQKQFFLWASLVVIVLSRMFIPITLGLGIWRYMLSGTVILLIFFLLALRIIYGFLSVIFFSPKPE